MKKRLLFVLVIVSLGGMLLWANEDNQTLQSARFTELLEAPLAQSTEIGEFTNVRVKNADGRQVINLS